MVVSTPPISRQSSAAAMAGRMLHQRRDTKFKRTHITMPGITGCVLLPIAAFTMRWEDESLRTPPLMGETLQLTLVAAGLLPIIASNILAGAYDRIFDISMSGGGTYFKRLVDEHGRIHLRGDLSLLPGAGNFGMVEWFLYVLLIVYIAELVVVCYTGRIFAESDTSSWRYLSTFLGVAAALMLALRYFIKSISIAVLKREQDHAYNYVRTFRRQRLYPCTFFQFICVAYQLSLASSTTVLTTPVSSIHPDIDHACAPINADYMSANCTRSLALQSLNGYVCADAYYYGPGGYRSAYDACVAARQLPLYLAQSIAALLLSLNAVLLLIFMELPQFSKRKPSEQQQGDEPSGGDADVESVALLPAAGHEPFHLGEHDNILRSQLRRLGKLFVMAALLVTPLWMSAILIGPRDLKATEISVSWSVRLIAEGQVCARGSSLL